MPHENSITVERDGQHFIESSVEPGKVLEGPFSTQEEADLRAEARSDEFNEVTESITESLAKPDLLTESTAKNKIIARDEEGNPFAVFSIEGSTPNEAETQAMLEILASMQDPEPLTPKPIAPVPTGEGPLGLMPVGPRMKVRKSVEEMSGLAQLTAEMSPAMAGTFIGATKGLALTAAIPIPGARIVGTLGGGMLGGLLGETIAQETGIAPKSNLNMALSGGGPLLGPVVGGTLKGLRRTAGAIITKGLPAARVAMSRNVMGRAVSQFESIGTTILSGTKGVSTRTAHELYEAAAKAGVRIAPNLLKNTRAEIARLVKKLTPMSDLPDVGASLKSLEKISSTLLSNPKGVLLTELIEARGFLGHLIGNLQKAGGSKLNVSKKVFAVMNEDLARIAKSPFKKGAQARLAVEAIKRAKLQFSVTTLENKIAQFTQRNIKSVPGGIVIDFKKLSKWLTDITNPKRVDKYDKNFTEAMKDHLPALKKNVDELAEIVSTSGSPGGPGSLVIRGQLAKMGRAAGGAALGFMGTGGNLIGAGMGAVLAAQAPELIVAQLTTPGGAKFLNAAARLGKGEISWRAWMMGSEIAFRALGEKGRLPASPGGPKSSPSGPVTIDTPTTLRNRAKAEEAAEETVEPKRTRKRLSDTKGFLRPPIAN